jgi:metal-responsive CopG/Arc/MetJ family transcriptional regulator
MSTAISITLEDGLSADLDAAVGGGNRSAFVATAIREHLDRTRAEAAARWHASLTGRDADLLAAFDAAP